MNSNNFEQREVETYFVGRPVELKGKPGKIYVIQEYNPMMVPPIWLSDDSIPHYPYEIKLMNRLFCPLSCQYSQAA